jgi:tyrosinase
MAGPDRGRPRPLSFLARKVVSGTVTIRKSVYALTAKDVQRYRLAVSRIAKISGESVHDHRGFQYVAGIHGLPGRYCKHHRSAFAVWHRPYVQRYEQMLQDAVPDAFVPYWDWTTHTAQTEGIPAIFTEPTWKNPDTGKTEPNPLLAQPKSLIGRGATSREPNPPAQLAPLRALAHTALLAQDYHAFSPDLENPHDQLHGWCGGDMGLVATAAYDPLFWSHHAFVEYLFCQWQDSHPEALAPTIDARLFAPFSVTVAEIWDYHKLGYAYGPELRRLVGRRPLT